MFNNSITFLSANTALLFFPNGNVLQRVYNFLKLPIEANSFNPPHHFTPTKRNSSQKSAIKLYLQPFSRVKDTAIKYIILTENNVIQSSRIVP